MIWGSCCTTWITPIRQNITPMFFRAVMRNGVIDVAGKRGAPMILQALADYYEYLVDEHPDRRGTSRLVFPAGGVHAGGCRFRGGSWASSPPKKSADGRGRFPEQAKRTVGIAANLLCDNATYLLGIDAKGKPDRARQCFEAARERHLAFLADVDSPAAAAVRGFFETWDPATAVDDPVVAAGGGGAARGAATSCSA